MQASHFTTLSVKLVLWLLLLPITAWAVPPTPVNAPRAHPLAPNPHTSVGLFWIYADANTGREWTGGTYKVKRCTGVSCTPTTVIVTGLTNADYQDTGLSANTTYGYLFLANDGSDSADSPTVYVTTEATNINTVVFPDSKFSDLLGPLVEEGQIPFSWYVSTMKTNAQTMISKFPVVAPFGLQGTGSISNGSTTLTGTGTFFMEQVAANNPTCLDAIAVNGINAGPIDSVDSNGQITLELPWAGSNQTNVSLTTNVPGLCGFTDPYSDYISGNQLGYYDSPMGMWKTYFMTGDPQYMRGAKKFAYALFAGVIHLGRNRGAESPDIPQPRNLQFDGLILLGLAGENGVWDWLEYFLTLRYPTWLSNYRGGTNDFTYQREKFYMIRYTNDFIITSPDTFKRSDGSTTSNNGATTVDNDLTDGRKDFWRDELNTDLPGFIAADQAADGLWYDTSAAASRGEDDFPYPPGIGTQPFIGGLGGDALGMCWKNTNLSSTARDAARKQVLRLATALMYLSYNTNVVADDPTLRWNNIWYFTRGGSRLNPDFARYGADSAILNNTPYPNMIGYYRQSIPLMLTTLGFAYEMSSISAFKTYGDEWANDAFAQVGENSIGSGADGKKSLCDSTSNFKDWGQCWRTSPNYFAMRLSSPTSIGTPPTVTMPGNITLTGGVNQANLSVTVGCTHTPCVSNWTLEEYHLNVYRYAAFPTFYPDNATTTKLSGLGPGTYKVRFWTTDSLGQPGTGTVNVTVGDGVFPPVINVGRGDSSTVNTGEEGFHVYITTSSSVNLSTKACSATGRSLTHSFSAKAPKDKSAPTITPGTQTGTSSCHFKQFTVSGLSAGLWIIYDEVTDSAGSKTKLPVFIRHTAENQPSGAHNTIPDVLKHPNHVLPAGSTSTKLYVNPIDPEGIIGYPNPATGYTLGYNGDGSGYLVTKLTHAWSQIGGPVSATITTNTTNCTELEPCIDAMTSGGTYTFRYTGTDQQGDAITADITVTTTTGGPGKCNWHAGTRCQ